MVLPTVTRSPENGGTFSRRMAAAMQPPVAVPAKGGPESVALVTRPDGANVTVTLAVPLGSPSLRQLEASLAAALSAPTAAARSNSTPGSAGAGLSTLFGGSG